MELKIKKLSENAVIPQYANPGDAGLDLTATEVTYDYDNDVINVKFGIALDIPEGYVGLLFPRSSIYKKDVILSNSVGVIDSSYKGEIQANFTIPLDFYDVNLDSKTKSLLSTLGTLRVFMSKKRFNKNITHLIDTYAVGERACQLLIMPVPTVKIVETDTLSESERGEKGFGSSGK